MLGFPSATQLNDHGGSNRMDPIVLSSTTTDLLWDIENLYHGISPEEFIQHVFDIEPFCVETIISKIWRLNSKFLTEYQTCYRNGDKSISESFEDILGALGRRACRHFNHPFDSKKLWMHLKHCFLSTSSTSRTISLFSRTMSDSEHVPLDSFEPNQESSTSSATNLRRRVSSYSDDNKARTNVPSRQDQPPPITLRDLELARGAVDGMAKSGRHYATRVCVEGHSITFWYYDRVCVVRAVSFDFVQRPELLALFAYAISCRETRNDDFDPHPTVGPYFVFPTTFYYGSSIIGTRVLFRPNCDDDLVPVFCVDNSIYTYPSLIGRGTVVYGVREEFIDDEWSEEEVLKMSWPSVTLPREGEIIEKIVAAIPEWRDHLPEVTFSATYTPTELDIPRIQLLKHFQADTIEERDLHVLAMKKYLKLWQVGSLSKFKQVFVDCVECHHQAWRYGRVLHGDLSENNLMFKRDKDGVKGVVNDWDMATPLNDTDDMATSPTGTTPFMAQELLCDNNDTSLHFYRHDLESFFYILIWAAVHYDLRRKRRINNPGLLETWSEPRARGTKIAFLVDSHCRDEIFHHVGEEFKPIVEEWLLPLWRLFRGAYISIPERGVVESYDVSTCGGRVTFETFMGALGREPRHLSQQDEKIT